MMTDEQKARILQLHAMGMGYTSIGKEMGIKRDTIKSFISRNKNALPTTRCDFCGRKIVQIPKQKPKRFCSDQCRMRWWSSHQEEINRKAYHTFTCNYCGKEFTVYGKKDAKYCSVECTVKRVREPMKPRGKNLKRTQYLAERHYRICLQVVSALLADGLLTEREAVRVRKRLKKMYEPVVGALTEDDNWKEVR